MNLEDALMKFTDQTCKSSGTIRLALAAVIYNLDKVTSAVGVVIASYVAQFFIISFLVVILIKLAY